MHNNLMVCYCSWFRKNLSTVVMTDLCFCLKWICNLWQAQDLELVSYLITQSQNQLFIQLIILYVAWLFFQFSRNIGYFTKDLFSSSKILPIKPDLLLKYTQIISKFLLKSKKKLHCLIISNITYNRNLIFYTK